MATPTPVYPPVPQAVLDAWGWASWTRQPGSVVEPNRAPTASVLSCLATKPGSAPRRSYTNANPSTWTYS